MYKIAALCDLEIACAHVAIVVRFFVIANCTALVQTTPMFQDVPLKNTSTACSVDGQTMTSEYYDADTGVHCLLVNIYRSYQTNPT